MKAVSLKKDTVPPPPDHVAIIMDGNGRWARSRGLPRVAGHRRGAESVRTVIKCAAELEISYLTLFGFSSENWRRPADEVSDLMGLLRYYLESEIEAIHQQGVRLSVIGERQRLSPDIIELIEKAEQRTAGNTRLTLTIAISYGGRAEITAAARSLAREVAEGRLDPDRIDENEFQRHLFTAGLPDPDLLIRTSGEMRISNFLLWQLAYSEFVFVDTLWPDFTREDFEAAVDQFRNRVRRYGVTGD